MSKNKNHIIISGGGTGGHIFPALSIANALKEALPDVSVLFVGAVGRMEMEKVPEAGYEIIGLPIMGMPRKISFRFLVFGFKLFKSLIMANKLIKKYKPLVVIGVGGYASGPVLKAANRKGIPTVLQEQNSFAGVTNRLLAKKAAKICVAYESMERYFPKEKIVITGNPVRKDLLSSRANKEEACAHFKLNSKERVILVLGGSLGAGSINQALKANLELLKSSSIQWIWQCGNRFYAENKGLVRSENIVLHDFIKRMDMAYRAADLVISRAGAGTISELSLLKKASILVPSPNVAEDHQTKNAMALVNRSAAVLVSDKDAPQKLVSMAMDLCMDELRCSQLSKNIENFAYANSDQQIVDEVIKLIS